MINPVAINSEYYSPVGGPVHYEGLAKTRSEVQGFSTDYAIGSEIMCSADWSLWILSESGNGKAWTEVTV